MIHMGFPSLQPPVLYRTLYNRVHALQPIPPTSLIVPIYMGKCAYCSSTLLTKNVEPITLNIMLA